MVVRTLEEATDDIGAKLQGTLPKKKIWSAVLMVVDGRLVMMGKS